MHHLTFVRPNGYLSMDDPWVEILDDVPRTIYVSAGGVQVANEDDWCSDFELQQVRRCAVHMDRVEVLHRELVCLVLCEQLVM